MAGNEAVKESKSATGKRGRGRPRGSKNKFSVKLARKAAAEHGQLPHEYLYALALSDELSLGHRIAALKAAAPYYAPRLSSIEAKVDPFGALTDAALDTRIARLTLELQERADGPATTDERTDEKED